jgi:two-component system chemotaxis sensor kinase CheA
MNAPTATEVTEQFSSTYRDEARELLGVLEAGLLELEARPDDAELVGSVFRALHTIKGSGAMFGFTEIATFTHALENAFDEVRKGRLVASAGLVGLALRGKDVIRGMLDGDGEPTRGEADAVLAGLAVLSRPPEAPAAAASRRPPPPAAEPTATYRVSFKPALDLLQDGTNPLALWSELLALGSGEVVAHTDRIPDLDALDPEGCYTSWDAILTTARGENAIRDVFIFVEDRGELRVARIDDGGVDDARAELLGEILLARGAVQPEALREALSARPRLGEVLQERGLVTAGAVDAALAEQRVVRKARAGRSAGGDEAGSSVRVGAEKLDGLVDLVGELVIAQARLSQIAASRDDAEIVAIAEDVERLTASLRDNALNLRMVPIGSTFGRFKRLVHDLSAELGKQIELVTEGAETELDKTVIERLGDPLVHLIRNSCDHGLESPAARVAAGKAPAGKVRLAAFQSGPNVIIEIEDDGAGLDAEAIRAKAVARGLIEAEARLSDAELFPLVFLPGFSTAQTVSSVSGRGVGMDVVKRSVEALRGAVEIASARGQGTTIRIKLPLTLAIIEGLLVSVGAGRYVLPMSLVEECVEITRESVDQAHGAHLVPVRGELVPYLRLREWFGEEGLRPAVEQVAIASAEGMRFGFAVDDVIGQQQTVIKTLGRMYGDADGLSGATILGDGTVALIVDVAGVIRTLTAASPS